VNIQSGLWNPKYVVVPDAYRSLIGHVIWRTRSESLAISSRPIAISVHDMI